MNVKDIDKVYFVGIGGIGMSALARYFKANQKQVAGYDKTPSPLTNDLISDGIHISYTDSVEDFPKKFLDKANTLVVYTPAIPSTHRVLSYLLKEGFTIVKRSELLGLVTATTYCFAVGGTHGKTTTSSILGHILQPLKATSFLGGIATNYNSNLILGEDKLSVVEADEFDRSFLALSPNIACITSTDADHLDIYGDHNKLLNSFKEFSEKVSDRLIVAKGVDIDGLTYAVLDNADYQIKRLKIENGSYVFDVLTPTDLLSDVSFHLPGHHNLMNALAAIAMADQYSVPLDLIKQQLNTFRGVERRFSYRLKTHNRVLIDDYAHHPTEIRSVYQAVREMYPSEKVLAVFQPHLYSRTLDFALDFAKELSLFDQVMLLDIYPARELPIKGVTSSWLLDMIEVEKKLLVSKGELLLRVKKFDGKVILLLGAGDIGLLVDSVKQVLEFEN